MSATLALQDAAVAAKMAKQGAALHAVPAGPLRLRQSPR
jgi:hypothetical protein